MNLTLARPVAAVIPLALLAASACSKPAAPPAPSGGTTAVESATLGVKLTELPEGFSNPRELGGALELLADLNGTRGTVTLRILERPGGVSLVEEVKGFGASASAAGGTFYGGNELVTPYGAAYTARAAVDNGTAEERRVFLLHPDGSQRLLVVNLHYPPGDAEVARGRLQQMLALLAALEPLTPAS